MLASEDSIGTLSLSSRTSPSNRNSYVCIKGLPKTLASYDLLRFLHPFESGIHSITILLHAKEEEGYMALIRMLSTECTDDIVKQCQLAVIVEIDNVNCDIWYVDNFILHDQICHNNSSDEHCNHYPELHQDMSKTSTDIKDFVSTHNSPLSLDFIYRKSSHLTMIENTFHVIESTNTVIEAVMEDLKCPLCLDTIVSDSPKSYTTYCGHTFHISCISKLESTQCPVCRYEHNHESVLWTQCQLCHEANLHSSHINLDTERSRLLHDQEIDRKVISSLSPPVTIAQQHISRHPHPSLHSDRISSSSSSSSMAAVTSTSLLSLSSSSTRILDRDIWLCLVCGFVGCGNQQYGHIYTHYEETSHTYIINTDTRHVWDCAGNGYVHRLVMQLDTTIGDIDHTSNTKGISTTLEPMNTGMTMSYMPSVHHDKLYEVSDIHHRSEGIRSHIAPLTHEQEEYAVAMKIEQIAEEYSSILVHAMNEQRLYYEETLSKLRSYVQDEVTQLTSSSSSSTSQRSTHMCKDNDSAFDWSDSTDMSSKRDIYIQEWLQTIQKQLQMEKNKLCKQLQHNQEKCQILEREYQDLLEMNTGLRGNELVLRQHVEHMTADLNSVENSNQKWIDNLQGKVDTLMSQLGS